MEFLRILYGVYILGFVALAFINKQHLAEALKGPDGRWDLVDIVKAVWLILFPLITLSGLLLKLEVQKDILYTLDAIFFLLILDRGSSLYLSKINKKSNEEQDSNSSDPGTV